MFPDEKRPSNIEQKWNKRKTKKSIPITLLLQTSYRNRWLNQRLGKARMVLDWFSAHHIYIEPFAIASKISRVDEKSTSESTPSSSDPTSTHRCQPNWLHDTWHKNPTKLKNSSPSKPFGELRSTSCGQWMDLTRRTHPWKSTSVGRYWGMQGWTLQSRHCTFSPVEPQPWSSCCLEQERWSPGSYGLQYQGT